MSSPKQQQRHLLIRKILVEEEFPENIIRNPKRISKTLGFCETGDTLTELIIMLLELFKKDEELVNTTLQVINSALDNIEKKRK